MTQAEEPLFATLETTAFARPQAYWPASAGTRYRFDCFSPDTPWVRLPAVYVLAKTVAHGEWVPLFVGETENLREAMADLAVQDAAERQGMDTVHVHFFTGPAQQRAALARALVKSLGPPLNTGEAGEDNLTQQRSSVISRPG
jgi:hypothetical protein